ncbi:TonB family protein [Nostoc commune NIES-4072]|uniref:TonB family protein n=1 Tax=Nostoc commune NIES-4072 TaxID=2005467 RepID=A0A2R5FES8_NOSCO|nr:energy transducer TonB [Nostoc commune]BBD65699.1 TonB family protein [Nostoc commune HK-02]GBG16977.1 TonB family protein [Nostoc commune NIES-4072]
MSFSGITVEQRSKEVEALKSFLTYSLIGSLALHIGVLSSGIGNYLTRVPKEDDDAIELAIVDSPAAEPEKPLEKIPEEPKKLPEVVQKQSIETPPVQKTVQEFIERPKIQPVEQPKQTTQIQPVEQPKQTTQNPQPTNTQIAPKPFVPVTTVAPQGGGGGSGVGLGSGSGIAVGTSSGTGTGGGTGTGTGGGTGTGTGGGTGTGIGRGTGSSIGNEPTNRPPVATAPTAPTPPKITPKINSSGNANGRAACRECSAKYPEAARRRGVEGRVEVAVDTDAQGNVTNVRVARSSGNRDLDEETMRQARNWKLKPAEGGRQGVSIATEFAIKGSRRSRQVQERQARRQAEEKTRQTTAANSTQETPGRRRRELPPSSNGSTVRKPAISGFSRRLEPQREESLPTNSSSGATTTRTQGSSIQREQRATDSSQKPQSTTNRRRRRDNTSQNKLRDSLRRLRQQPQSLQSQPAAPSQE